MKRKDHLIIYLWDFHFFYVFQNTVFEQNQGYNCAIVSLITRKILVYDIKYCYKNISKIRNVTFFFFYFQIFFQNRKNN